MKKFIPPILVVLLTVSLYAQTKEYVCLPCGAECDQSSLSKPGNCEHCGMPLVEKSTIKFKNISVDEMCQRISANPTVVLLDVRTPAEFNGTSTEVPSFGHFKKAININVQELESRLSELAKYKNAEVIVYCSHSHRSPRASYLLGTKGFTNVKNMAGGVSTIAGNETACLAKAYEIHKK